jgi:hypothetical protein
VGKNLAVAFTNFSVLHFLALRLIQAAQLSQENTQLSLSLLGFTFRYNL